MVNLKHELQATPDCLAIERLGEPLTEPEQAHVRSCSRCEAEQSLWQSFRDSQRAADEGAAVQWVVSELRRRRTPETISASSSWWRGRFAAAGWRPLAAAAAIVLAVGAGYLRWDPEPRIAPQASGAQTYRTTAVTVSAPRGDIASPPSELIWVAIEGAKRYDIQVLEIDHSLLWSGSSQTTRVELPRSIINRIVPGKTLLWTVTAVDGSDRPIAESGPQSFRVIVPQDLLRN